MNDSIDLGGSGGSAFSWGAQGTQPGTRIAGKVLGLAEVQSTDFHTGKPETWDNGDPKMQYRVTMQTNLRDPANPTDQGVRDVYLDGSRKVRDNGTKSRLCAVLDAVKAVTGGTALAVGGQLELVWVSGMGYSGDPRNYEARYLAPQIELGAPVTQQAGAAQQIAQQPVAVPQGQPFAQQQVQAYAAQAPAQQPAAVSPDPWATQQTNPATQAPPAGWDPLGQPVQQQQLPVQTEQGPVNPQTGQVLAPPPGITAEAVAAVRAGGMDPATVWPGVDLSAFGA